MPSPTRTPGSDNDRNVGQRLTDELVNNLSQSEKHPAPVDSENPRSNTTGDSQTDSSADAIRQKESAGTTDKPWIVNRNPNSNQETSRAKQVVKAILNHKRGVAIGGGATGGIIGLVMFFSSMLGLPSLGNMLMADDPSSRAIQSRILKPFAATTSETDPNCVGTQVKTFNCKSKRISLTAIGSLEKAGITALDADGNKIDGKKSGYPERNPASYQIDVDGNVQTVRGADLASFMEKNNKIKGRVFGTGGVFNPAYKNWSSKYLSEKLLRPAGINKTGGLADGENKKLAPNERAAAFKEKLAKVIPGFEKAGGGTSTTVAERISKSTSTKVEKQLGRAKKGGVGYLASVSACVGVKLPMYFAAGVAAVQIAQVLPVVNEIILSPSSKAMASGGDPDVEFTGEDADLIMSTLTEKYPDEDGKMASALDSEILQSALGVNTGRPNVSEDFAPGYAAITAPLVVGSIAATAATAPACNAIMSPASMYSAMAVEAATVVALSPTVIGGVIKVFGSWAISEIAIKAATALAGAAASAFITELATNDNIPTAQGKELGDLLGTSMYALKSSAAAARNIGVLRESDLPAINEQTAKLDEEMREMDIAALSPFDTSSKYTFLGNIASNFNVSLIASGGYGSSVLTQVVALAKMPFMGQSVGAAPVQSYAEEFGLSTNGGGTPCITVAGTPCYGLTNQQASMSTAEASAALYNEDWIDDSKEITDDSATITDLVEGGQIKADTPLHDFVTTCGDLLSGDYIVNAGSCTTISTTKSTAEVNGSLENGGCVAVEDSEPLCPGDQIDGDVVEGVKDTKSLAAMTPALLDYQIAQSFNGFDEPGQEGSNAPAAATGKYVLPVNPGYQPPNDAQDWGPRNICSGGGNSFCKFHRGVDFAFGGSGQPVYSIADGEVIAMSLGNPGCSSGETSGNISRDNRVLIRHADGAISGYSHMPVNAIRASGISVGSKVTAGQQIGVIGNCGNSFGAHLHFTINPGAATNPAILSIGSNANGEVYLDPQAYLALYGVQI